MAEKNYYIESTQDFRVVKCTADKLAHWSQRLVDDGFDEVTHHYQGGRDWVVVGRA